MLTLPRLIAVAGLAVLFGGLIYVGYINEQLKGAIAGPHRLILLCGFLVGVSATARWIMEAALKLLEKRKRSGEF